VAVWGSTATFDAVPASDLDVAVVVETDRLERCELAVRALVVWPWRLALLGDERTKPLWPSGLDFDDPAMPVVDRAWLRPDARNRRKHEAAAVLLGSGLALAGDEPLATVQAAYGGMPAELRRALAHARRRLLVRAERKLGSGDAAEDWRRRLLLGRAYLGVLALRELEPHEWALNYHAVGGRLAETGAVPGREWRIVRDATLWTIAGRGRWDSGEAPPPAVARPAARSLEALRDHVDARLAARRRARQSR
jgi:hypothetical protein